MHCEKSISGARRKHKKSGKYRCIKYADDVVLVAYMERTTGFSKYGKKKSRKYWTIFNGKNKHTLKSREVNQGEKIFVNGQAQVVRQGS